MRAVLDVNVLNSALLCRHGTPARLVSNAVIVSGDRHLLDLGEGLPVYSPAEFLTLIESGDR